MTSGEKVLEILSKNIKNYRKEKSWTQEKLAEEAELSVQAVNFFEGKRRWPGEDSLSKLATALGVEVYQLFIPEDNSPVIIEKTPETEKIKNQLRELIISEVRCALNTTLDKIKI